MGLLGFFETIFAKVKHFFEILDKDEPQIEKAAALTLALASPLLDEVVGLAAGSAAEEIVSATIAAIQKDMADAQATLTAAGPAPTVTALLNAMLANLGTLLIDSGVKNSSSFAKIESAITQITKEVEAILKAL